MRPDATIAGLTPTWFVSPGNGQLDQDGAFVGYEPGDYLVTAILGGKQASTVVHLEARDVRRSVTVVGRLPRTAVPDVRSLDPPERQSRLPRHPRRRRSRLHDRHQQSRRAR